LLPTIFKLRVGFATWIILLSQIMNRMKESFAAAKKVWTPVLCLTKNDIDLVPIFVPDSRREDFKVTR